MQPYRAHVLAGLTYLMIGLVLGIVMAKSHDHSQHVTHAHILLIGFLLSTAYGLLHKSWAIPASRLSWTQFGLHHTGTVILLPCLYLLYGSIGDPATVGMVLGITSLLILAGAVVMMAQFIRAG